jgi:hypothetical protein
MADPALAMIPVLARILPYSFKTLLLLCLVFLSQLRAEPYSGRLSNVNSGSQVIFCSMSNVRAKPMPARPAPLRIALQTLEQPGERREMAAPGL